MTPISTLLRKAAKAIERLVSLQGRELGLTARQIDVLLVLNAEPGLNSAEIGKRITMGKSTTAHLTQLMITKGLIQQEKGSYKSSLRNFLTPLGKSKIKSCVSIETELEDKVSAIAVGRGTFPQKLEAIAEIGD